MQKNANIKSAIEISLYDRESNELAKCEKKKPRGYSFAHKFYLKCFAAVFIAMAIFSSQLTIFNKIFRLVRSLSLCMRGERGRKIYRW